ncbi:MAG: hypothetical protein QW570_08880 [Candidatus Caldarchaeum sp.]
MEEVKEMKVVSASETRLDLKYGYKYAFLNNEDEIVATVSEYGGFYWYVIDPKTMSVKCWGGPEKSLEDAVTKVEQRLR